MDTINCHAITCIALLTPILPPPHPTPSPHYPHEEGRLIHVHNVATVRELCRPTTNVGQAAKPHTIFTTQQLVKYLSRFYLKLM